MFRSGAMELRKTFQFRNAWIGIAMLWIMFFHAGFWIEDSGWKTFKELGYGGVDFCLFASGIGCYFSLEKDPDILCFLKRRVKRLSPAYFCFIIPWLFWKNTVSELPVRAVLGNLLGVQTLASWDYHFNWYIGGLVIYYFSMPYLKRLTDACSTIGKDVLAALCLMVATVPFWDAGNTIVLLSRLPIVYAGMVYGKMAKEGCTLGKRDYLAQGVLVAAGIALLLIFRVKYPDLLWSRGLYWYPFALIVPGCCMFFSLLAEQLEKYTFLRWINRFLGTVGVYSFELYLVHVFLYEGLMGDIMNHFWYVPNNLLWLLTIPVVACGTFLLNRVAALAIWILEHKKAVKKLV